MIKGVIFDMDGVLVDNRDIHFEAFMELGSRYGLKINTDILLGVFGQGNDEILPAIMPKEFIDKVGLEKLSEEKEEIYRNIYYDKVTPTRGLLRFLDDIRHHGVKCAVGSSGPKLNVDFVLEKCDITDKFDAVVNGDIVEQRKPDPAIFLLATELMSLTPEECLVIEDSKAGILSANNAGMAVVAMATTFSKEQLAYTKNNMIVSDFSELSYDIIKELRRL